MSLRQFAGQIAGRVRLASVENREDESEEEKNRGQPTGDFGQDVRRLRAENIFRDAAAESRAETLAFRALHQDHEHH